MDLQSAVCQAALAQAGHAHAQVTRTTRICILFFSAAAGQQSLHIISGQRACRIVVRVLGSRREGHLSPRAVPCRCTQQRSGGAAIRITRQISCACPLSPAATRALDTICHSNPTKRIRNAPRACNKTALPVRLAACTVAPFEHCSASPFTSSAIPRCSR